MSGRRHRTVIPLPSASSSSVLLLINNRRDLRDSLRDTIRHLEAIEPHVRDYQGASDTYALAIKQHRRRWNQLIALERAVLEEIRELVARPSVTL